MDQRFGIVAWYQHCRGDHELQTHEFLTPQDILERFALCPAGYGSSHFSQFMRLERLFKVDVQPDPVKPQRGAEEPFSLQTSILHSLFSQISFGPVQNFQDGPWFA